MFGFFKKDHPIAPLTNMTIGTQSALYGFMTKKLAIRDDNIRKMELTYAAISIMSCALEIKGIRNFGTILQKYVAEAVAASIPHCNESIDGNRAIKELVERNKLYARLIFDILQGKNRRSQSGMDLRSWMMMEICENASKINLQTVRTGGMGAVVIIHLEGTDLFKHIIERNLSVIEP
jgi:hypothetical protein